MFFSESNTSWWQENFCVFRRLVNTGTQTTVTYRHKGCLWNSLMPLYIPIKVNMHSQEFLFLLHCIFNLIQRDATVPGWLDKYWCILSIIKILTSFPSTHVCTPEFVPHSTTDTASCTRAGQVRSKWYRSKDTHWQEIIYLRFLN